jgi:AraC-like DNA-binding protein
MPLKEICRRLGFKNQSHFSREFRRSHKLTPLAFRKKAYGIYSGVSLEQSA